VPLFSLMALTLNALHFARRLMGPASPAHTVCAREFATRFGSKRAAIGLYHGKVSLRPKPKTGRECGGDKTGCSLSLEQRRHRKLAMRPAAHVTLSKRNSPRLRPRSDRFRNHPSVFLTCRLVGVRLPAQDIRFGNSVSHSERKTRRSWKPNVHKKRLWSEALNEFVTFNVTCHALKCIDKAGGLDAYLLTTKPEQLRSSMGDAVRVRVAMALDASAVQQAAPLQ